MNEQASAKASPLIDALTDLLDRQSMSSRARLYRRVEAALILIGLLAMVVGTASNLTAAEHALASATLIAVLALFALAIGNLIRHTAGAITTVIGLVLVVGPLLALLPYSWGAHIHEYFPTVAGALITADHQASDQLLSPWQGFGVFCAWTALLLAAGAYLLQRRDT